MNINRVGIGGRRDVHARVELLYYTQGRGGGGGGDADRPRHIYI